MEITEFVIRILTLFIPGIITLMIIEKLTNHKPFEISRIFLYSFVLGFIGYSLYYLIIIIINKIFKLKIQFIFFKALVNSNIEINFLEIIIVSSLSLFLGFLFAWLINIKIIYRLAHSLRITKKFGEIDVFSYIMSPNKNSWVEIRDIENDLTYQGWIEAYSDGTERDELFLRDVIVYKNSTAQELYKLDGIYIPKKRENLIIEFQEIVSSKENSKTNRKSVSRK